MAFRISALVLAFTGPAFAADAKSADFFEKKIRPLLVENCQECHGPKKQSGGIRFDGAMNLAKASGGKEPVLVPSKPKESRLILAVRHEGEHPMPPKRKLSATEIADLTAWVESGAHWPVDRRIRPDANAARKHWAFQPLKAPALPKVKDAGWPSSPVDSFILAKLEASSLSPSKPADKRILIRRVTFDLTGLPPIPQEIDDFLKDNSPNAFEKVVDRLLNSASYGERWGRHWLDLARYSDTKGYVVDGNDGLPFAYTYRDWVIRAFNNDLPYDQFLIKQIAADHLPKSGDNRDLAALGFLTLGRRFDENEPDLIDDRLDVITRGTLGLTVTCARCHDHKYDPVPTKDYYSLYGVFAGATDKEVPIWANEKERQVYLVYARELWARQRERDEFLSAQATAKFGPVRRQAARYLMTANAEQDKETADGEKRTDGLHQKIVDRWKSTLSDTTDDFHPILAPWHEFAGLEAEQFVEKAKDLAKKFAMNQEKDKQLNPLVAKMFEGNAPKSLEDVANLYGKLFLKIENRFQAKLAQAAAADEEPPAGLDGPEEELRAFLYNEASPTTVPENELNELLADEDRARLMLLRAQVDELRNSEDAPPHAVVLNDPAEPVTPQVFIRGKADKPGDEVPRQFLAVLAGKGRKPFPNGTGRLDLAKAIASRTNPLTARVWVNRVWMHHFGDGLVKSPSDFGLRSEAPSHPELLDYLADRFMADGWSTKKLHRSIVLSKTYQQASAERAECRAVDSENRLLWRMNRLRLEFEPLRDALLAVSGKLDRTVGGKPVAIEDDARNNRRTVYLRIDRLQLPAEFRAFDFANPDLHSPKRHETIVPQQSLYLMNSPFVAVQARALAAKLGDDKTPEREWLQRAYREIYGREATALEVARGATFLEAAKKLGAQGPPEPPIRWKFGYGIWDEKAKKLQGFQPFPHFADGNWRASAEYPDPKLDYLALNAEGGHPGKSLDQVVVRRWIAPFDGIARIQSTLGHALEGEDAEADGVRGQIDASSGVLLSQTAFKNKVEMNLDKLRVKKGDTVDFIIDCRKNNNNDTFTWPVSIQLKGDAQGKDQSFSSVDDFEGPREPVKPLSAREKLAQVLLLANEFLYVD